MAIAFVQGNSGSPTQSGSSGSYVYTYNVTGGTAGNLVFFCVLTDFPYTWTNTSSVNLNSITTLYSSGTGGELISVYSAVITANGSYSIVNSTGYSIFVGTIYAAEFSGCNNNSYIDSSSSNIGYSSSITTGNLVTAAGELVLAFGYTGAGFSSGPSGFSKVDGSTLNMVYNIESSPGTYNPTWVGASGYWWGSYGVSVKVYNPNVYMTGSSFGVGSVVDNGFTQSVALVGTVDSIGSMAANMYGLAANVQGTATVTGDIKITALLAGIVQGTASVAGNMTQSNALVGTVQGTATVGTPNITLRTTNGSVAATNTCSVTITGGIAGNLVIIGVAEQDSSTPNLATYMFSSSTNVGTFGILGTESTNTTKKISSTLLYTTVTANGSYTITYTNSNAIYITIGVAEFLGCNTTTPLNYSANNNGHSTNPNSSSLTASINNIMVGLAINVYDTSMNLPSGYSSIFSDYTGTNPGFNMCYKLMTSSGSSNPTWTAASDYWAASAASLNTNTYTLNQSIALASVVSGVGTAVDNGFGFLGAMAGVCQGTATVSDSNGFNVTIPLNSVSYGITSVSDTILTQYVPLNSVCYGVNTSSLVDGSIAIVTWVAGIVNGIASVTGDMNQYIPLTATIQGTATLPDSLTNSAQNALVGEVDGYATITGALNTYIPLTTTVNGVATVSGTENAIIPLISIVNALASVSGDMTQSNTLSGTINGVGSAYAALNIAIANYCVGAVQGTATVSGNMNQTVPMSATAYGVASAAAVAYTTKFMSGQSDGVASLTGTPQYQILGKVQCTAVVSGDMNNIIPLLTTVYGIASMSGEVGTGSNATAYGKATVIGDMNTQVFMSGTANGIGSSTFALNTTQFISGEADGVASVTGNTNAIIPLQSIVYGQGIVSGASNANIPLNATSQGIAIATGSVTLVDSNIRLSGIVYGIGSASETNNVHKLLAGVVYGIGSGSMFVPYRHGNIFTTPLEDRIYLLPNEEQIWTCPKEKRIIKI